MSGGRLSLSSLLSLATVLASRGGGAAATLVALILLARNLPADDVGVVVTVQSAAIIFGLFATLNIESAAIRVLPGAEEKAPGTTAAYFALARQTVTFSLPIVLAVAAVWFAFGSGLRGWGLFLSILTIPAAATLRFGTFAARGLGEVRRSSFINLTLRSVLYAVFLALLALSVGMTRGLALSALLLAFLLAAALQFRGLQRLMPPEGPSDTNAGLHKESWRRTGLVLMTTYFLTDGYANTVILLSSLIVPEAEMARLVIGLRLAILIQMIPGAVTMTMSPELARQLNLGQWDSARHLARRMTLLGGGIAVGGAVVAGLFAGPLLGAFGDSYAGDRMLLWLLLLIPLISAATGPALPILSVTGANRLLLKMTAANTALTGLTILLAAPHGVLVLAGALVGAHLVWRASLYFAASFVAGINPWALPAHKAR